MPPDQSPPISYLSSFDSRAHIHNKWDESFFINRTLGLSRHTGKLERSQGGRKSEVFCFQTFTFTLPRLFIRIMSKVLRFRSGLNKNTQTFLKQKPFLSHINIYEKKLR